MFIPEDFRFDLHAVMDETAFRVFIRFCSVAIRFPQPGYGVVTALSTSGVRAPVAASELASYL